MDKGAKIFVAGHNGLVGSAILRFLKQEGYTNFALKTHAELDLTDGNATDAFFAAEKPEYVFLAAAKVGGIYANNTYRADFIVSNLKVQDNVISASFKHKVKKLLFLGSSCIYPKDAPQPIHEDTLLTSPLEYTNEPYAIAKIAGIKMIESYNIQYGTNYLSVMPTNLYGHNDNFDLEKSHVMPALIRKMVLCTYLEKGDFKKAADNLGIEYESDEQVAEHLAKYGIVYEDGKVTLRVWGSGEPYREFLHVNDMAEACVFVMNNLDFADLTKGQTEIRNTQLNIGTGKDLKIKDLVALVKDATGFNGTIEWDSTKPDGTMRKLLSVEKINGLGWKHKIELEDGLKETVAWYREHYNA